MTLRDLIVSFLISWMSFLYFICSRNSGKIRDARILDHMPILPAGKGVFLIGNDIYNALSYAQGHGIKELWRTMKCGIPAVQTA